MKPALYRRFQKHHAGLVGKQGVVVGSTQIHVAAPEQSAFLPYSYVLVEIDGQRRQYMGAGHEVFQIGDAVVCCWRRLAEPDARGLISYGIKVTKVKPDRAK